MTVAMRVDLRSSSGYAVPKSFEEALEELRVILPPTFYQRLLRGFPDFLCKASYVNDAAVQDRFLDLLEFMTTSWNLRDRANPLVVESQRRPELQLGSEDLPLAPILQILKAAWEKETGGLPERRGPCVLID